MTYPHLANIALHVGAGTLALLIGFVMLAGRKGTAAHRRWGKVFCALALVVSLSAAVGTLCFRFTHLVFKIKPSRKMFCTIQKRCLRAGGVPQIQFFWIRNHERQKPRFVFRKR